MRIHIRTMLIPAVFAALLTASVSPVHAQTRGSRPPVEFSATYGSMWGGDVGLSYGKLRTGTGGSIGLALDVPMASGTWVEASYNRQDGSLDWDRSGQSIRTLSDMSVNIWHLGTIRSFGRPDSPVIPYVQGSVGATFFSPTQSELVIDGESYHIDDTTKFSIAFGAGFKAYFGAAQKVGLRASFKFISSLFDSGGGMFFGPGGVQLGVSGSGIWQYEAAGGLTVRFGG